MERVILKYEGRYTFIKDQDNRSWRIVNHFKDRDGQDRHNGSFLINSLKELGIVPGKGGAQ